jgi:hypothetical protein
MGTASILKSDWCCKSTLHEPDEKSTLPKKKRRGDEWKINRHFQQGPGAESWVGSSSIKWRARMQVQSSAVPPPPPPPRAYLVKTKLPRTYWVTREPAVKTGAARQPPPCPNEVRGKQSSVVHVAVAGLHVRVFQARADGKACMGGREGQGGGKGGQSGSLYPLYFLTE